MLRLMLRGTKVCVALLRWLQFQVVDLMVSIEVPKVTELGINGSSRYEMILLRPLFARFLPNLARHWYDTYALPGVQLKERARFLFTVVRILFDRLHYRRFKLVRQKVYQLRFAELSVSNKVLHGWLNRKPSADIPEDQEIALIEKLKDQGSSGPFGDAALDWRAGRRWRDLGSVIQDIVWHTAQEERSGEWFDIHATL
ncbi:unnamed protein product [Polarella glacialis]|uniref:Peroxisomal membrane protein PEX16 n=1 Tax=Polarella glacialis TaxID=89957 RepID=A0A813JJY4_POLGL|nr:unnamed protein product [Polarella glacialis]